jgi:hypothetical protein
MLPAAVVTALAGFTATAAAENFDVNFLTSELAGIETNVGIDGKMLHEQLASCTSYEDKESCVLGFRQLEQIASNEAMAGQGILRMVKVLKLCEVVARELPLPLGCSNVSCCSMAGRSETATAKQLCTRCRVARYCSSECQKAHWEEHRGPCRRIAADAAAAAGGAGGLRQGKQEQQR